VVLLWKDAIGVVGLLSGSAGVRDGACTASYRLSAATENAAVVNPLEEKTPLNQISHVLAARPSLQAHVQEVSNLERFGGNC